MLFFSLMLFVYWRKYIWKTNHFLFNPSLILPFMQQLSNIMLLEVNMVSLLTKEHKYVHVLYIILYYIFIIFFLLLTMFMWILGWFSYLTLIFLLQLLREKWNRSVVSDSLWPIDCSLSGSSVHGIFQARVLEWIAIAFSRGSSRPRDRTQISCIAGRRFTVWATREA